MSNRYPWILIGNQIHDPKVLRPRPRVRTESDEDGEQLWAAGTARGCWELMLDFRYLQVYRIYASDRYTLQKSSKNKKIKNIPNANAVYMKYICKTCRHRTYLSPRFPLLPQHGKSPLLRLHQSCIQLRAAMSQSLAGAQCDSTPPWHLEV